MDPTAPLRHVVAPGEYRCLWTVPNEDGTSREIHGDVELRPDRQVRGSAYGNVPLEVNVDKHGSSTRYPQKYEYPLLWGQLLQGQRILLIDALLHVWDSEQAAVVARAALVGQLELDEPIAFDRARIQVSGLDSLAGIGPIRSFEFPKANAFSGHWRADAEPDSAQEWADSTATLRLDYIGTAAIGDPFRFQLAFSPSTTLTLNQAQDLDGIVKDWVGPLQKLAALCIGKVSQITYVALGHGHRQRHWFQLYGAGIHQNPFASSKAALQDVQPAFSAKADEMSVLELLRRWQDVANRHHPLIETYGTFLTAATAEHPRSRFLLLIQALEGLHGHENADEIRDRTERHLAKRAEVFARLGGLESLEKDDLKFLKASVMKRPPASLNEPLKWAVESLPIDLTTKISSSNLIIDAMTDEPEKCPTWIDALRVVRNHLAHGTKGFDANHLDETAKHLDRVARSHTLRILGCGDEALSRVLQS